MRTASEWDDFYRDANPWGTEGGVSDLARSAALLQRLRHAHFRQIADFGCGEGRLSNELSKHADVTIGYDISERALQRAKNRFPHIEFVQGDLLHLLRDPDVLAKPFDFVSVAEMLYYLQTDEERVSAVNGLAALGVPKCLFFFSVIVSGNSKHRRYFSHSEMLELLSTRFVVIESFPCLARESLGLRVLSHIPTNRATRVKLVKSWTALQMPEKCKHAGYFALKRELS